MTNNWRTPTNAADYFGSAKKVSEIEQRRPSIRRPSDLVGPGIASQAVRVNDWNNTLATFNGYYCGVAGAANAPDASLAVGSRETFVGFTSSDAEKGGTQIIAGLTSGVQYSRSFNRNPADPARIYFGAWNKGGGGGGSPTGTILDFAGPTSRTPDGYLFCNGQAVSRTTYADLFTVIGTQYGSGNGSSTFNIPNLVDRVTAGAGVESLGFTEGVKDFLLALAQMVSHSHTMSHSHTASSDSTDTSHAHSIQARSTVSTSGSGFVKGGGTNLGNDATGTNGLHNHGITVSTHTGSTGSTPSGTQSRIDIMQPTMYVNKIIKT